MILLVPYAADIAVKHTPWVNWALVGLIVAVSVVAWTAGDLGEKVGLIPDDLPSHLRFLADKNMPRSEKARLLYATGRYRSPAQAEQVVRRVEAALAAAEAHRPSLAAWLVNDMVLAGWHPVGMLGHVFLHANLAHLFGNMIFLLVFGNAVCGKIGGAPYLGLFFLLALVAAAAHNLFAGGPAVGASGAVNGVVGMFLVLYPLNNVRSFYYVLYRVGVFTVGGVFVILYWLAFDILGAALGLPGVAYWAHLGGIAGGFILMSAFYFLGWVKSDRDETILWEWLGLGPGAGKRRAGAARAAGRFAPAGTRDTSPGGVGAAAVAPPPEAPSAPSPGLRRAAAHGGLIAFDCLCGKGYRLPDGHAGRHIRCIACGEFIRVPEC
jgi:membrane associated rhomboid family serine protease